MNIAGTEVNPNAEVEPVKDVLAQQIAQIQANLDMLYDVQNKRIQITNQKDRDNIEAMIKDLNDEIGLPVWQSQIVRQGAELSVFHEYRAELRGRLAILKDLVKSDIALKEQIADTEKALKALMKKAE